MLTDNEKTSIELQEQYRHEVAQKFKTKSRIDYVETIIKIVQGLAIIFGIYFTWREIKEEREKENRQHAKDFSKDFHERQLNFYAEALDATSAIAIEEKDSPDYLKARTAFYRLFWGRMSFVEDKCVEAKMVQFEMLLREYEKGGSYFGEIHDSCTNKNYAITSVSQQTLKQASLRLAHEARHFTVNTYLDDDEKKNYNPR